MEVSGNGQRQLARYPEGSAQQQLHAAARLRHRPPRYKGAGRLCAGRRHVPVAAGQAGRGGQVPAEQPAGVHPGGGQGCVHPLPPRRPSATLHSAAPFPAPTHPCSRPPPLASPQPPAPPLPPSLHAAGRHVLEALEPYSQDNGGPLIIQHVSFVEGRGNILVAAAAAAASAAAAAAAACSGQGCLLLWLGLRAQALKSGRARR